MLKKLIAQYCFRIPKKNYNFENIKSVLIRPFFRIGDCVIHTASIRQLKEYYPNIKIGVLITKYNKDVFINCPHVDEVIPYKYTSLIKQRKRWQVLLDYPGRFSTYGLIFDKLLQPDYVICFEKEYKKSYNFNTVRNYDFYCHDIGGFHFSQSLRVTPFAHVVNEPVGYSLKEFSENENPYTAINKDKLLVLLCVEGSNRCLPLDLVINILKKLAKPNIHFIILNTQNVMDYYSKLSNIEGLNISLAPKTDFDGFLQHVYFTDAVITLDTATVHIACAYKKPMLALNSHDLGAFKVLSYENCEMIMPANKSGKPHDYSVFTVDDIYLKADALLQKLSDTLNRV